MTKKSYFQRLTNRLNEYLAKAANSTLLQGVPEPYRGYAEIRTVLSDWLEDFSPMNSGELPKCLKARGRDDLIGTALEFYDEYQRSAP